MPKEKNSTVDFLNNIDSKEEIFKEEPKVETSEDTEDVVDEKSLPFHKDEKVQRYVAKQIEKALKDFKPTAEQSFRKEVDEINLPASFIKLVGNDTDEKKEVLKDLSKYFGTLKGEARQEFLNELKEQEAAKTAEDVKAQEELDTAFEEIEENYGVDLSSNTATAKKTRSDFVEYVRKIAPKNADGEVVAFPDLNAAFEVFQERTVKTAPASRAKELASRGMTRSTDTGSEAPKGRSWKDVDRFFEKLKAN